jgi:hypothetical protein
MLRKFAAAGFDELRQPTSRTVVLKPFNGTHLTALGMSVATDWGPMDTPIPALTRLKDIRSTQLAKSRTRALKFTSVGSFAPQRDRRIHLGRSPRRNPRGQSRHTHH